MFRSLRRLLSFRSSHPLDDDNLGDHARDITFRVMEGDDIATCMGFYRANEAAHFPPGLHDSFERKLQERRFLTLLAMREGRPVGCCGINYKTSTEGIRVGFLCFGMVDPPHQRQGIGTAQVLVRLALLDAKDGFAFAGMAAIPNSVSFYCRFGFRFEREVRADDGNMYHLGLIKMSQGFIDGCRRVLAERRITYPDVRDKIPHPKDPA